MRLQEFDYNYQTKNQKPIEFKITEDFEGDNNRGWRVDRIDAFVDGNHAGYIKLSWIPQERFDKWYSTIFHFISYISGRSLIPHTRFEYKGLAELSESELYNIVKNSLDLVRFNSNKKDEKNRDFITNLSAESNRTDLIKGLKILENKLLKTPKGKKFKEFYQYHVDKPIVDYIQAFKGDDVNKNKLDQNTENFQRQGVGTALYIKAAKYLKSLGLQLHASNLQSPEAQSAWTKLEKMGIVQNADRKTIAIKEKSNKSRFL